MRGGQEYEPRPHPTASHRTPHRVGHLTAPPPGKKNGAGGAHRELLLDALGLAGAQLHHGPAHPHADGRRVAARPVPPQGGGEALPVLLRRLPRLRGVGGGEGGRLGPTSGGVGEEAKVWG